MGTRGESTVTCGIPQPSALVQDRPVAGRLLNVTAQHDPAHSRIRPYFTVGSAVILVWCCRRGLSCKSETQAFCRFFVGFIDCNLATFISFW